MSPSGRSALGPLCGPCLSLLVLTGAASLTGAAVPARAQSGEQFDFLFGQKPKPFIDPAGFYAAILPNGFDCEAKARHVKCSGNRGVQALLTIDVIDVPASATADIAMLNQMDRFKEKPHFKQLAKGKTKVDGTAALTTSFTYDYMGNVEYAVGVQQLIMVRGGKLYLIHLETRLDQFATHKKDLEQLYGSFKPARLDAGGNPILEDLKPQAVENPDQLPDVNKALRGGRF
jgi:hypothetical protein